MDNNKGKKPKYEIIKQADTQLRESKLRDLAGRKNNIFIGTLNVFVNPIKKRHQKHYRKSKFHLVADILLVLIVLILISTIFWIRFSPAGTMVELEAKLAGGPVVSGQDFSFSIGYKNGYQETITRAGLTVELPKGFVVKEAGPSGKFDPDTSSFYLGDLLPGANGEIFVSGVVWTNVGEALVLPYRFSYYSPEGKNKSIIGSLIENVESSALATELITSELLYQGSILSAELAVTNRSSLAADNIIIGGFYPDWQAATINCSQACRLINNSVRLSSVAPGETEIVELGLSSKLEAGAHQLLLVSGIELQNENFFQVKNIKNIQIEEPRFKAWFEGGGQNLAIGEPLALEFKFINNEAYPATGAIISFGFLESNLKVKSVSVNKNNIPYSLQGAQLQIAKTIMPGDAGTFSLVLGWEPEQRKTEQTITPSASVAYLLEGSKAEFTRYAPVSKVLSDISVVSAGRYYSPQGDQLGIGPLPPVVDIPTAYWIFWEIANFGNEVDGLSLSADLPVGAVFTGKKSALAGKLDYGADDRRVLWRFDKLAKDKTSLKAGFEIEIVPTGGQIGQTVLLLKNIKYQAYDTFCEQKISANLSEITTDLDFDDLAKGKGKVQPLTN